MLSELYIFCKACFSSRNPSLFFHTQPLILKDSNTEEKLFINGIENRIEQIIANLLDNSISFSYNNKKILVELSKDEDKKIILKVIDEGKGFKETSTKKIFDRFYHKGGNNDSYEKGFGIGLSLAKNLIEVHKGFISVTSKPGIGSKFIISLPLKDDVYLNEEKADNVILKSDFTNVLRSVEYQNIINEPKVFLNCSLQLGSALSFAITLGIVSSISTGFKMGAIGWFSI